VLQGPEHFPGKPNVGGETVVPNGNGTSTVIAPDGSVRIIPTPK
jgi:hypothetical protein